MLADGVQYFILSWIVIENSTMPLGPRVVFTRSLMAMAPTKEC